MGINKSDTIVFIYIINKYIHGREGDSMKQKRRYDNYDYNEAYQYDLDKEIEKAAKEKFRRENPVDRFRRTVERAAGKT